MFITYSDCPVSDVQVDPADIISDHSLVTGRISTDRCPIPTTTRVIRSWRRVDRLAFQQTIHDSALGRPVASQSPMELFALYESELTTDTTDCRSYTIQLGGLIGLWLVLDLAA